MWVIILVRLKVVSTLADLRGVEANAYLVEVVFTSLSFEVSLAVEESLEHSFYFIVLRSQSCCRGEF